MQNTINVKCTYCEMPKDVTVSYFNFHTKRGWRFFCDRQCKMLRYRDNKPSNDELVARWTRASLICEFCGDEYIKESCHIRGYKYNYCSSECRQKWRIWKLSPLKQEEVEVTCLKCWAVFKKSPYRVGKNNFCDLDCWWKYYSGERRPNRNWGTSNQAYKDYPPEFNLNLKELIRDRDNRKCFICNVDEKNTKRKLAVHHIDYNKKHINPENLVSLCDVCHWKTHHDRDNWLQYFTEELE
jgi:hypothetical protein